MVFLSKLLCSPFVYRNGAVVFSRSKCIYENLALESLLFDQLKFEDEDERGMLLMWINRPCVVIGRHQNPWLEADLKQMHNLKIDLVRRNSGGGTVFHDEGNLNLSFIGPKRTYNRKRNLQMICDALRNRYEINAEPNDRDDIIVNDTYKVSGTASKLAHKKAYHHCTLLVDVNKELLSSILKNSAEHTMETKCTRSVRADVLNLKDVAPQIEPSSLAKHIGEQFCAELESEFKWNEVEVTEEAFPGIKLQILQLRDWEWTFGWTPRFKITTGKVTVKVYRGRIEDIAEVGAIFDAAALGLANIVLRGKRFTIEEITTVLGKLESQRSRLVELREALEECVRVVSNV